MNQQAIIFLGRSGSGKGTQAKFLKKMLEPCLYIYTGDLFRELAQKDSVAGKRVKEILDVGGLPGEWLAEFLWQGELIEKLKVNENIIMDGTPRRLGEAQKMDEVFEWLGCKNVKAILVDVTEEEVMTRLSKRFRSDDTESSIKSRLNWFEKDVVPVIEYYESSGRLIRVNGIGSIEEIFERIKKSLNLDD